MATIETERISLDELSDQLDALAREKLGISGEEFLHRCRDHSLDMASPGVSRLAVLGRLLLSARERS